VQLKQYGQRIFGESPRRTEQACNVLVKLKLATYTMGKAIDDPDGPDEIQKVNFMDMGALESFFEFYQYYYFKGGAASVLKYDESCFNLLSAFAKMGETPLCAVGGKRPFCQARDTLRRQFGYFELRFEGVANHFENLENYPRNREVERKGFRGLERRRTKGQKENSWRTRLSQLQCRDHRHGEILP
jgi:hypothetical protein